MYLQCGKNSGDKPVVEVQVGAAPKRFTSEEISASVSPHHYMNSIYLFVNVCCSQPTSQVLRKMKESAEAYLGEEVSPRCCHCSCLFQRCSTSGMFYTSCLSSSFHIIVLIEFLSRMCLRKLCLYIGVEQATKDAGTIAGLSV